MPVRSELANTRPSIPRPVLSPGLPKPAGNLRWFIAALLALATTINYIDRSVLSFAMLDDSFRHDLLGLPISQPLTTADVQRFKEQMGLVDSAFKWAYGLGFVLVSWLIDRIGTRRGFSLSILIWSLAAMSIGFVKSIGGMALSRFTLGLGESGNYPSAIKSVAEWFPSQERALATGVFNSGANIGIILTAVVVPWLTLQYGWRSAFILTGAFGLILLLLWLLFYRLPEEHSRLSQEERSYILSDPNPAAANTAPPSWFRLLTYRQTWAFVAGKVFSDPIWWFYLTWLPDFFNSNASFSQKLDLKTVGLPFLIIYLVSDLGNLVFGWLSSHLIRRGWSPNGARKTTMLVCSLCVLPVYFASVTTDYRIAIGLIALATAAHQGFSVNNFTIISDVFPKPAIGSVVGIGGLFGAVVSGLVAVVSGLLIARVGYLPLFIFASTGYLAALGIIHLLVPKLDRVNIA